MKINKYSASRAQTFQWCDFKYHLTYELYKRDELSQSRYYFAFGEIVHEILEYIVYHGLDCDWKSYIIGLFNQQYPFDNMNADGLGKKVKEKFYVDKQCKKCPVYDKKYKTCKIMRFAPVDSFEGCPKYFYLKAIDMVEDLINRYQSIFKSGIRSELNPNGKILGVEHEFNLTLDKDKYGDDIKLNGFIDLIVENDAETIDIIDYKTGKSKSTTELMKDIQARTYAYVISELFPQYPYQMLTFEYLSESPVTICFTKNDIKNIKQEIKDSWHQIKNRVNLSRRKGPEDFVCKYMCDWNICSQHWAEHQKGFDV